MSAGWDDEDFDVPVLPREEEDEQEEEERYVAPRAVGLPAALDPAEDRPVLLLDLAALAAQLGNMDADSYATVREHVMATLHSDFTRRSEELLASGMCWHAMRSVCEEEREAREASRPGSCFTMLEYPAEVEGLPIERLWDVVARSTDWECVNEVRAPVGGVHWRSCLNHPYTAYR